MRGTNHTKMRDKEICLFFIVKKILLILIGNCLDTDYDGNTDASIHINHNLIHDGVLRIITKTTLQVITGTVQVYNLNNSSRHSQIM